MFYKLHLPAWHLQPEGLSYHFYHNRYGKRLRYAYWEHPCPLGAIIYTAGLSQPLESDYENFSTLHRMGFTVYGLERYGEADCERMYPGSDYQKPPALLAEYFAIDLIDFMGKYITNNPHRPLYLMGSCYGGLVALLACKLSEEEYFDKVFLISPMLGSKFLAKNGGEQHFANLSVAKNDECLYYGKARDWSPELASKLITNDNTSSDPIRRMLRHWWFYHKPNLRLGGFTYGRLRATARSLLSLMAPGVPEAIQTPIVIISAGNDLHNENDRHIHFATRLPYVKHHFIEGAGHGLWREADLFRDQLLDILASETGLLSGIPQYIPDTI